MLPRQWKQSVTNLVGMIAEILKRHVCSIFNYQTIGRLNAHEIAISPVISCWERNGLKDWRLSQRNLSARRGICLLKKEPNVSEKLAGDLELRLWWTGDHIVMGCFIIHIFCFLFIPSLHVRSSKPDLGKGISRSLSLFPVVPHKINLTLILLTFNMAVVIFHLYPNK